MEYIHGLNFQAKLFFQSLGFGFILGIIYDVFRIVRAFFQRRKSVVIIMDTAYFILCGFLIFCFALVLDYGEIRAYLLAGNLFGWMIYYFSMGFVSAKIRIVIRRQKTNIKILKFKMKKNKAETPKKS